MSRRLLLVLALLLGCAGAARAQDLEQLERRAQVLKALNTRLLDSMQRVASRAFDLQPRVTVAGDGFAISAPDWAIGRLARAAAAGAPHWRERYGSTFEKLRDDTLVVWIEDAHPGQRYDYRRLEWRFAGKSGKENMLVDVRRGYDPLTVFPSMAVMAWERSLLDSATTAWLWAPVAGWGREGLIRGTQLALIFSRSGPARRCLAGRIEDCERLLDIDSPADSVTRWYDPSDSAWVRAVSNVRSDVPGRTVCTSGKDPAGCVAFLRAQGIKVPRPVGNVVRESFYRFVVETGGDGAMERFHSNTGRTVAEHLSAVAGRPVNGLVSEWRAWLDRGRSDPQGELIVSMALAVGWMVLFVLLFAWRFRWIRA